MLQTSSGEASVELLRETGAALFVINLCASTTPVALAHPDTPELKRFNFFVTRRREEGRERFRLHMGYFDTLEQAETMLAAVRDIYPAAWAGPAPDHRGPTPRATARPTLVAAPPAPAVASAPPSPTPPLVAAAPPAPVSRAPAPATRAEKPAKQEVVLSFEETMSNVREVLAHLDEDTVPAASATTLTASQTLALLETAPEAPAPRRAPAVAPAAPVDPAATSSSIRVLTPEDTQTLRDIRLEQQQNAPASFAVQLLWSVQPIDTDALPHLAIFDAYTLYHVEGNRNGRRWYGLRLGFFTDPEAARQVAQYVRSEYTSVAVLPVTTKEKNGAMGTTGEADAPPKRDVVAKAAPPAPAVAKAPAPKHAATAPAAKAAPALAATLPPRPQPALIPTVKPLETLPASDLAGFELLPDEPRAPKRDLDDASPAPAAAVASGRTQPPKATGKAPGKRAVVRPRPAQATGGPKTLEETLEILGASTLTLDESREVVTDAALRKSPVPKKERTGRFARLLSRLSDRAG